MSRRKDAEVLKSLGITHMNVTTIRDGQEVTGRMSVDDYFAEHDEDPTEGSYDVRDGRYLYGPIRGKDLKYAVQQAERNEWQRAIWRVLNRLRDR